MMRRLRNHLLGWLIWPTLALSALGFRASYQRSLDQAHDAYDRTLLGSAMAIAERLSYDEGRVLVDVPYAALEMLQTGSQDRIFYRVVNLDGAAFVSGYEDLPAPPARLEADRPRFHDADYRGEPVRMVALVRRVYDPQVRGPILVQVGETMGARELLSRRILLDSALVQLALIAAAALLIAFGVHRGLLPLKRLRDELRARDPDDLSPIDTRQVPREVVPLVDALNVHTQRQRELTELQQRFFANASHQLKTPLAVLRTQSALALRQTDIGAMRELVQRMHDGTEATGRLVQQLLTLARSDPGLALAREDVDLAQLADEVLLDLVVLARSRRIDLGLDARAAPVVRGERVLLREMVANLVHNALVYTPAGGRVTVHVETDESGAAAMIVEDDGPGIPQAERERVFDRFYRVAGSASEGSGLGLSIVQEVCRRHGVRITLADGTNGRGLRVELRWPQAAARTAGDD
jgi:two-component system sensor histidine kinase TctE